MNSRHLVERFEACRERGQSMVLVSVWETLGSTYSKAGARMLITADGDSQGLVSGGCLEGDLAARAQKVIESNRAETVVYDLRDDGNDVFGLGIGCNGLINVLLQPLTEQNGFQPMAAIADALLGTGASAVATVIESGSDQIAVGVSVVLVGGSVTTSGAVDRLQSEMVSGCEAVSRAGRPVLRTFESDSIRVLFAPLVPVPRVLILGAGPDAVPLVNIIAELGWRVWIADHRPAYLKRPGLDRAESIQEVRPDSLAEDIELRQFDAIVIMSHHLDSDRQFLRQISGFRTRYIGLLGPPARKERLLAELGNAGRQLQDRLHGPAGIDIGADTAESIAVSIAAEMQQVLSTAV